MSIAPELANTERMIAAARAILELNLETAPEITICPFCGLRSEIEIELTTVNHSIMDRPKTMRCRQCWCHGPVIPKTIYTALSDHVIRIIANSMWNRRYKRKTLTQPNGSLQYTVESCLFCDYPEQRVDHQVFNDRVHMTCAECGAAGPVYYPRLKEWDQPWRAGEPCTPMLIKPLEKWNQAPYLAS